MMAGSMVEWMVRMLVALMAGKMAWMRVDM